MTASDRRSWYMYLFKTLAGRSRFARRERCMIFPVRLYTFYVMVTLESTNVRERDRKHEALPDLMHPWFLSPPLLSYLLDYNSSLRACPVRQDLDRS